MTVYKHCFGGVGCTDTIKPIVLLQLGFDSLYFARIDYQDRAKRKNDKTLEIVWQGSKSLGSSSQVRNL